jgi:exodeoxyribonuclease VII large subunit
MRPQAFITLTQLAEGIREAIDRVYGERLVWVVGEVVDHKQDPRKGHHYFCLAEKEANTHSVVAKLSAAAWNGGGAQSIRRFEALTGQQFRNNIEVLVCVRVQYSRAFGLKLIVEEIDTNYTIGQLELQRRRTIEQLLETCPDFIRFEDGRFITRNNSLKLPPVLQRIAVLTSQNAAGYKDFEETIRENRFGYNVWLEPWFTVMQGESNAAQVCQRLIDIFQSGIQYDAVVIIRGGGSQTDLLLFDQYILARAVAKFPVPIITGIGHQINQSIVDLMAHSPLRTPSIAAESIIAHNREFEEELLRMQQLVLQNAQEMVRSQSESLQHYRLRLISAGTAAVSDTNRSLNDAANALQQAVRIHLTDAGNALVHFRQRIQLPAKHACVLAQLSVTETRTRMSNAAKQLMRRQAEMLRLQAEKRRLLDPVNILKRGFAIVYRSDAIVADGHALEAGQDISIRFFESKIEATITKNISLDEQLANL